MNFFTTCRRGAQVPALGGLFLALVIAAGCGPKAPPPPSKPSTEAPKTNAVAAAQTNLSDQYTSVFEDLPPQKGRDPFFPASHRRDPAPEAVAEANPNAPVEPVLSLRAVIPGKHSQAVINHEIFEVGEVQSVRVPNGHVRVRCIDIGSNYVLIQVTGEAEPKKLMMEQKKN
jgi:hypothetical protein